MPQRRIRDKIQLTQTQLKLIAAFFMTFGSLATYAFGINAVAQSHSLFSSLGWISAPIFLFCLLESLRHTSSRAKLLLRLYLANVLFSLVATLLNLFIPLFDGAFLLPANSAFASLFFTALIVTCIDALRGAIQSKNRSAAVQAGAALVAAAVWCAVEPAVTNHILAKVSSPQSALLLLNGLYTLLPSLRLLHYTAALTVFGVLWYFVRGKKWQAAVFVIFCALLFAGFAAGISAMRLCVSWFLRCPFCFYTMAAVDADSNISFTSIIPCTSSCSKRFKHGWDDSRKLPQPQPRPGGLQWPLSRGGKDVWNAVVRHLAILRQILSLR